MKYLDMTFEILLKLCIAQFLFVNLLLNDFIQLSSELFILRVQGIDLGFETLQVDFGKLGMEVFIEGFSLMVLELAEGLRYLSIYLI